MTECNQEQTDFPVVHVWSPEGWHESTYIVGNKEGLTRLYQAIGTVLNKGEGKVITGLFIADGEGYDMEVTLVKDEDLDRLATPYLASYARERREHTIYPWDGE